MDGFDLRALRRALGKLPPTADRPIARRNARQRVLKVLRAIRTQLDREYPAIVKRKKVERLTPQGRVNRLKRAGWSNLWGSNDDFAEFVFAGVPIRRVHPHVFVPAWAIAIGSGNTAQLRAAKGSRARQKAAIVAAALTEGATP